MIKAIISGVVAAVVSYLVFVYQVHAPLWFALGVAWLSADIAYEARMVRSRV